MSFFRYPWVVWALLGFLPLAASAEDPLCGELKPYFMLVTAAGPIRIELYPDAAPKTLGQLVRLASGPVFNVELFPNRESVSSVGYFDGLTFNYTNPHVEIIVEGRPPDGLVEFESEISAEALGLDKRKLENAGAAMDVLQMELMPAYQDTRKSGKTGALLGQWVEEWYKDYNSDFLVGTTQQKINEALGYVYQKGLKSRPVVKGAVALKPSSPGRSTARLTILLTDIPERTGRWVVIGRVAEGLDTAEAISVLPRVPGQFGDRWFRPLDPVVIDSVRLECRND